MLFRPQYIASDGCSNEYFSIRSTENNDVDPQLSSLYFSSSSRSKWFVPFIEVIYSSSSELAIF